MQTQDFKISITVDQSPEKVFNAIRNVRGWWSEQIDGSTENLHDEFFYHYKDVHRTTIRVTDVIPNKRIVWLIKENHFSFTKDKTEWTGNRIVFDITERDGQTRLDFTQEGLVPEYECYQICSESWSNYICNSLQSLIATGKGHPSPKESEFNEGILQKHSISAR